MVAGFKQRLSEQTERKAPFLVCRLALGQVQLARRFAPSVALARTSPSLLHFSCNACRAAVLGWLMSFAQL